MRINVYSQELTKELKIVSKRADDTGITCHRLQGEEKKDDPDPKIFTAESLKAL